MKILHDLSSSRREPDWFLSEMLFFGGQYERTPLHMMINFVSFCEFRTVIVILSLGGRGSFLSKIGVFY